VPLIWISLLHQLPFYTLNRNNHMLFHHESASVSTVCRVCLSREKNTFAQDG
jgi:hypothetical protein